MTRFCNATREELSDILDWAAAEGWNPGLDDAEAFFAADPEGFFVAKDGDAPVAAISVVNHTDGFAFLGLYIVRPSHRGQGIGYGLWQHALAHAGDRVVGLDGVPDQQANYLASGFAHAGGTIRFSGDVPPLAAPELRIATAGDLPALIAAEAAASGVRKARYLAEWFRETSTRKTFLDADGFCTVRRCRDGAKVGPLRAADPTNARRLMAHAATLFGPTMVVDVPESAQGLADICDAYGMVPGFKTARMYRGPAPTGSGGLFAVATLELG